MSRGGPIHLPAVPPEIMEGMAALPLDVAGQMAHLSKLSGGIPDHIKSALIDVGGMDRTMVEEADRAGRINPPARRRPR